jgi:diadenosine tetraphosphatase ApaH/serine/threonine PP2A family protein phosphatase
MVFLTAVLAVLYDVHGNLPALEAVLADAQRAGAARFFLGGDYAAFGAWPAETVARLDELEEARWIRGNWDRWVATWPASDAPDDPVVEGAASSVLAALGSDVVARLGALPASARETDVLYCHASPESDMRGFAPVAAETDRELLRGAGDARLIVCGHTHVQYQRALPDGRTICNPGSVGLPLDGDRRAAYGLLHDGELHLELRRVAYDHAAAAAALRDLDEAWAEEVADRVERAAF